MIQLAYSEFWLAVDPAGAWRLLRHRAGGQTEKLGSFSTLEAVVQEAELPKDARDYLQELIDAADPAKAVEGWPVGAVRCTTATRNRRRNTG